MITLFLSLINLHVQWNPALQQFFLYDQLVTMTTLLAPKLKKQSVVIFSVKLVKKTIIFIFALPVLEDLQDVNIFQF